MTCYSLVKTVIYAKAAVGTKRPSPASFNLPSKENPSLQAAHFSTSSAENFNRVFSPMRPGIDANTLPGKS